MTTKKIIGALAIAGGLAGGGAVGAVLGTPGVSSAQSSTSSDSSSSTAPDSSGAPGVPGEGQGEVRHGRHGGGVNLETAANALGMTVDELRTELEAGKTIAQVAGEKGVDVQTVIDALVADATTRITDAVNNGVPRPPEGGPRLHARGAGLEAAATALGITNNELRTELEAGKTIAQVAGEKGVDVQTVIDAMVAEASSHLDQAVADGKITAEEAAARKAELPTRIADFVNNGGPKFGPGPGHPHD